MATFGKTTIGAVGINNSWGNSFIVCRRTAPASGTISAIYAYLKWGAGLGRAVIFSHNAANNRPLNVIATGTEVQELSDQWNINPINYHMTQGEIFWVGVYLQNQMWSDGDAGEIMQTFCWTQGIYPTVQAAYDAPMGANIFDLDASIYGEYLADGELPPPEPTPLTRTLHTVGNKILDDLGNVVTLRGVNRPHFHDSSGGCWGGWFTDSSNTVGIFNTNAASQELDYIKNMGCNVLRLITAIDFWTKNRPCQIDGTMKTHREAIKALISLCAAKGIYVILAPWQVDASFSGSGQALPFPPYYTGATITSVEDFKNYWLSVAAELGQFNNVIYELWNEAHTDNDTAAEMQVWYDAWNAVINAIRSVGDEHLIIVGYEIWHTAEKAATWVFNYPFAQTNLVYSEHIYRSGNTLGTDRPYVYADVKARLEALRYKEVADLYPFIIGEIGANLNELDKELQCFGNALDIFNDWGVGYAAWIFFDEGVFPLVRNKTVGITSTTTLTDAGNLLVQNIADAYTPPAEPSTVDISIIVPMNGTTSPSGLQTVTVGSTLSVSATSNAGYQFKNWLLDGADAGSANPITVLADQDHTLEAIFEAETVIPPAGGCMLYESTRGTVFIGYLPTIRRFRDRCLSKEIQAFYYGLSKILAPKIRKLRRREVNG